MVLKDIRFFGVQDIYYVCDACNERFVEGERQFRCWECKNFDLCVKCWKNKVNRHSHSFYEQTAVTKVPEGSNVIALAFRLSMQHFHDHPLFGDRLFTKTGEPLSYRWLTHGEALKIAENAALGLFHYGLKPNSFVGVCGGNRSEWHLADFAAIFARMITLPIHTTFDQDATDFIISNTNVEAVFCDKQETFKFVKSAEKYPKLRLIIQLDDLDEPQQKKMKHSAVQVISMTKLISKGKSSKEDLWTMHPWPKPTDLFTVQYTSGSTGTPKGVMITNEAYLANLFRPYEFCGIMFSYEPLAHSSRRNNQTGILHGGRVGFHSGDMDRLFEEIQIIRPSAMAGVPRVWNKLFAEYKKALHLALVGVPRDRKFQVEREVLSRFRPLLGDRVKAITCGGAPTSHVVMNFLRRCFRCTVIDGYGATETGNISVDFKLDNLQSKLVDWEEFKSTDDPPRGELVVKSKGLASGYFNNKEDTEEQFKDGWFHTGDIVVMEPGGKVRVIGRKKQIFKLAQGEYVSPEKLENIFLRSNLIDQLFIHGDSLRAHLVAIAVVNPSVLHQVMLAKGLETSQEAMCDHPEAKKTVLDDLIRLAALEQIQPYEIPTAVYLTLQTFTVENGLMTSTNKVNRNALTRRFKAEIEQLYASSAQTTVNDLSGQLKSANRNQILDIFRDVLHVDDTVDSTTLQKRRFQELGGDSLGAVRLKHLLSDTLTVDVNVQQIYSSSSVEELIEHIEMLRSTDDCLVAASSESLPQAATQAKPSEAHRARLDPEIRLPEGIERAEADISNSTKDAQNILLTGATGFIGLFLLSEILESTQDDVKVYCLVRRPKEGSARKRLRRLMKRNSLWKPGYKRRIVCIEGDLSKPRMALDRDQLTFLSEHIDVIYHNGALVNAVLGYDEQKAVNVDGTVDVIRLAFEKRPKILHHISTLSIFKAVSGGTYCTEGTRIESIPPPPVSDAYARTKYEAELLVLQAQERGLLVNIYRPGQVSGHSITGQCNTVDYLTRLLRGVIQLGVPEGCSSVPFELTPVDYVAKGIVCISMQPTSTNKAYHLTSKPKKFELILPTYKEMGYQLESHVWDAWHADLLESPDNPLYPLLHYFENPSWPWPRECDAWHAEVALAKAQVTISTEFAERAKLQLLWLKSQGLLPEPGKI